MKLTNATIYTSAEAVDALCRAVKLPVKTFFERAEGFRAFKAAAQDISTRQQMLLEQYGKKDNQDHFVQVEGVPNAYVIADTVAYAADWKALQEFEVEIPLTKFNLADFGNVELSVAHMMALDWLVDTKPPEKSAVG